MWARAEPVAQDTVSPCSAFTAASQGVLVLRRSGTNKKKEHLFLHFWPWFVIFLSSLSSSLTLLGTHCRINPLKKNQPSMNETLQILIKGISARLRLGLLSFVGPSAPPFPLEISVTFTSCSIRIPVCFPFIVKAASTLTEWVYLMGVQRVLKIFIWPIKVTTRQQRRRLKERYDQHSWC